PSAECCVNLILVFVVHNAWVCVLLSCNFMVTGYIRAECHLLRYLSVAPCLSHTHTHTMQQHRNKPPKVRKRRSISYPLHQVPLPTPTAHAPATVSHVHWG